MIVIVVVVVVAISSVVVDVAVSVNVDVSVAVAVTVGVDTLCFTVSKCQSIQNVHLILLCRSRYHASHHRRRYRHGISNSSRN